MLADGKTLQVLEVINGGDERWVDVESYGISFAVIERRSENIRIKLEPKKAWYRVSMCKDGRLRFLTSRDGVEAEQSVELLKDFLRWLTDRIEYELPEIESNEVK